MSSDLAEWRCTRWQRTWFAYRLTVLRLGPLHFEWTVHDGTYDESLVRMGTASRLSVALTAAEDCAREAAVASGSVVAGEPL